MSKLQEKSGYNYILNSTNGHGMWQRIDGNSNISSFFSCQFPGNCGIYLFYNFSGSGVNEADLCIKIAIEAATFENYSLMMYTTNHHQKEFVDALQNNGFSIIGPVFTNKRSLNQITIWAKSL